MSWKFIKIVLLVTGEGEEQFLPELFRSLMAEGHCTFIVERRISQLDPVTSEKRLRTITGTSKVIPTRDEELGLTARSCLDRSDFVVIVDDLEHDRRGQAKEIYERYRKALDTMIRPKGLDHRASVHFLVNMLEAYYFADALAVNDVLGLALSNHEGDVEEIRHPKNDLKRLKPGFREIRDGKQILQRLDVERILSNPRTCKSLRTLFAWCSKAIGRPFSDKYRLNDGELWDITREQLDRLPDTPAEADCP